ncbi:magnesium chelatase subunit H [Afifella sp. IM 167]|uniref:magnesium chelatase subunit H n=1 Tax=Afifella sp. IM 167 TaxID=2033586 RepID=UPI001CCD3F7E|nr:magnesium chelatase subunit H [Afifella sp. IM 167]MBZ8132221.1 magnesium chelatase subunit H [Afifella sp. IM 167]
MPKPISPDSATPIRVVIVTLDSHLASAVERAEPVLKRELPGLVLNLHAATEWGDDATALGRCQADIAEADIILANMMFMEDHIKAVMPALTARRESCDALVGFMSAGEVIRLTRLGRFSMDGPQRGVMALLKRLRGGEKKTDKKSMSSSGAKQMAMLRRLPQLLRFVPGTAQDLRAYFLTMQYWLAGSEENIVNMVRLLVERYASGPRSHLRAHLKAKAPINYPDVGLYHPRLKGRVTERLEALPSPVKERRGRVGVLVMRSYVLAGNTAHYDAVIHALEARGLQVVPAFSSGLDSRPPVEQFFLANGRPVVDAVVSLTGFSLVGGPAYNDAHAAEEVLARLNVPYIAAQAVEFQTMEQWQGSERGLLPVEATMMVAIPELDGATGPILFGGRSEKAEQSRDMQAHPERAEMLAARVDKLVALRQAERAERKLAVVLFNFPPNSGGVGTAAYLSVYHSLFNTLTKLKEEGYTVEVPESVDALRQQILGGNSQRYGTDANVFHRIPADEHVKRETWLKEIEAQWGPAPGRQQSDGASIFVLGERFGNVFVGIQPAFGYEGDPMRLLFEKSFAPTHAFTAFYRYLKEDFGAHAVLHFGMHGALEFMPGKQTGLSDTCWPDRLIGDLPNFYLYAANNPSEGSLAKRRAAATLISYLTPPVARAGLYRGLLDLKASLDRWRQLPPDEAKEREQLAPLIQAQAAELDLAAAEPAWENPEKETAKLGEAILDLEYTLIPHGLHVVGEPASAEERIDLLLAVAEARYGRQPERAGIEALVAGESPRRSLVRAGLPEDEDGISLFEELAQTNHLLSKDYELDAIVHALDGHFVRPAPGGDLLRTPTILPTGRNLHGFDPFRMPSAFAVTDGARQAERLLQRYLDDGHPIPESVALVLWGTDNLKSEGGPIAQALALLGARPRFDSFGRLCGAALIPLAELGRPRVDVVMTLSGIFRDLLPLQTRLLAEAAFLAATADEPAEANYVRKHALAYQEKHGCDLETAALRVFSNADGAYGSNVNMLLDSGRWEDEDELADTYAKRKCFAYGRQGAPVQQADLLQSMLGDVELAYQNLESVELGVTTVDHYFDTLGGISRSVRKAKGGEIPVYIGDQTRSEGQVRSLAEQVALETRTRMLNPKWYESMLKHGYEGVRQIEAQVTNTVGWSATTGQVAPWVYQQITQTYVLDPEMRRRMAELNPVASAKVAHRLLEAHERKYWEPDEAVVEALRQAGEELEDQLEGIPVERAA